MQKVALFHHDGVIVNSEPLHKLTWKQVFKEYGKNISEEELHGLRGRTRTHIITNFFGHLPEGKQKEIYNRKEVLNLEIFAEKLKLIEGVEKFLFDLKKNHWKIGLATSASKTLILFSLNKFGLQKYFDAITTGNDIRESKPHPEIYLISAKKLEVSPENCFVFEDSKSGVEAGFRAGMKVILVESSYQKHEFPKEHITLAIKDFTNLTVKDLSF